jgi:hypothetical protein
MAECTIPIKTRRVESNIEALPERAIFPNLKIAASFLELMNRPSFGTTPFLLKNFLGDRLSKAGKYDSNLSDISEVGTLSANVLPDFCTRAKSAIPLVSEFATT